MNLSTIPEPAFLDLKAEIERRRRLSGYYLIDLVSIGHLREQGLGSEDVLDAVFQHFDDQDWPPVELRPTDQSWEDYAVGPALAREIAVAALTGGPPIGHARSTIPAERSAALWERFEALFPEPRSYYVGMGFGDPAYPYQHGAAVVSRDRAGLIWIVESD